MCSFGGGDYTTTTTPEVDTTPTPTAVTSTAASVSNANTSKERQTIDTQRRKKGSRSTTLSTDRSSLVSEATNGSRSTLG